MVPKKSRIFIYLSMTVMICVCLLCKVAQELFTRRLNVESNFEIYPLENKLAEISLGNIQMSNQEHDVLEMVEKNKIGNLSIITVCNYGFRDLTMNWILSGRKNNYFKFVILSFDNELKDYLIAEGFGQHVALVPDRWLNFAIDKKPAAFETKNYYAITQAKTNIFYKLLLLNQNFIFNDVDCVWLNGEIIEYINLIMRNSYAHIIYALDFGDRKPYYNTGFFYATSTTFTKKLYQKITKEQLRNANSIDQFVLDDILQTVHHNDNRILTFDPTIIANGYYYFIAKMHLKFKIKPFTVHANYFENIERKIASLKSDNYWFIKE